MGWIGGVIGGTVAAIAAQEQEKEEAELIAMMQQEHGNDWEFKFVRKMLGQFANRETLRQTLEEEAAAGWELAAVLDANRICLKRPVSQRDRDHLLPQGVNPYRTGNNNAVLAGALLAGLLVLALGVFVALFMIL